FFSVSASEFVEMIVGVGASRVRDLFDKARQAAPAIIFIDELDAIGRSRGGVMRLSGNDEQEQTLNQILTEMDGFDSREGVIVLSKEERERIAYHEAGHALLGVLLPGADPVRKVSIVPRGMALGVTLQSPIDDRYNYPEDYLRAKIAGALGGRAAEKLVYGVVT